MKIFILLLAIFFSHVINSKVISSKITCLTSKCHSSFSQQSFLHSPLKAKGCVVCHEILKDKEKTNKKLPTNHMNVAKGLGNDQLPVCQKCHVEWTKEKMSQSHLHGVINKTGCTGCHNPHAGDNKKLLREKESTQALCYTCHKKGDTWEKEDKDNTHKAINQKSKCLNCHEIHSSKISKLLKAEVATLCVKCHDEYAELEDKLSIHEPVKKGECLKCHSPHYSSQENMLEKVYEADEGFVKNVDKSFELCLSCHNTNKNTQFKNGELNLHSAHLNSKRDEKFMGCSACHSVHSSTKSKLMLTSLKYKKIVTKIEFAPNDNGGTCAKSCHNSRAYDRINAVVNEKEVPLPASGTK